MQLRLVCSCWWPYHTGESVRFARHTAVSHLSMLHRSPAVRARHHSSYQSRQIKIPGLREWCAALIGQPCLPPLLVVTMSPTYLDNVMVAQLSYHRRSCSILPPSPCVAFSAIQAISGSSITRPAHSLPVSSLRADFRSRRL